MQTVPVEIEQETSSAASLQAVEEPEDREDAEDPYAGDPDAPPEPPLMSDDEPEFDCLEWHDPEVEVDDRYNVTLPVPALTPTDLNALDNEVLVVIIKADYRELMTLSRSATARLRGRLLPSLREVRDRMKAGLTVDGHTGFEAFCISIGIRPGTFRQWERREREALRQEDAEEIEPPTGKRLPASSPEEDEDMSPEGQRSKHREKVLADCARIIAAGLKRLARTSHPDVEGGTKEAMQDLNEAAGLMRQLLASSEETTR